MNTGPAVKKIVAAIATAATLLALTACAPGSFDEDAVSRAVEQIEGVVSADIGGVYSGIAISGASGTIVIEDDYFTPYIDPKYPEYDDQVGLDTAKAVEIVRVMSEVLPRTASISFSPELTSDTRWTDKVATAEPAALELGLRYYLLFSVKRENLESVLSY